MNESWAEIEWHAGSRPQEQVRTPRLHTASAKPSVKRFPNSYRRLLRDAQVAASHAEPVVESSDNLITMHMSKSTCSCQYQRVVETP